VGGVGGVEHFGPVGLDGLGPAVVHIGGSVEPDTGVAVLVVIPGEEPAGEGMGILEGPETFGELGRYLRVLNGDSLYGLSLLTCGRLWLLVTPRSARR